MIKKITYFAPHKTALTVSLVFALSSLLMVIPMAISFSFMPAVDPQGNPIDKSPFLFMVIGMPFFYFIFGYLFTGVSAWLYNKVSKVTGGIKYETSE
ncbi:MAG: hypothetical protein P1U54_11460 [Immundisolibacteraceae bacterium]|nr:hypothetical protein [Immundisolibacteraceae bacterium]